LKYNVFIPASDSPPDRKRQILSPECKSRAVWGP
jgi:hypothetical protein